MSHFFLIAGVAFCHLYVAVGSAVCLRLFEDRKTGELLKTLPWVVVNAIAGAALVVMA